MSADAEAITDRLCSLAAPDLRFMVAVVGPPGSGKSTLAAQLRAALMARGETAVVVPMDGFHYDDVILNARGQRPRKGAPFTYDVAGFEALLKRIRAREDDIAIPVFDRTMELSRAAADLVDGTTKFILVEGNYLLLDEEPWSRLKPLFDFTIFLDEPEAELERRLMQRWFDHGFDEIYARNWIASNDMLNIREVQSKSVKADLVV